MAYHRNGTSGEGFYLIDFEMAAPRIKDRTRMLGIVFHIDVDDAKQYAVVNPADPRDRYQGDHFIKELTAIIDAQRETMSPFNNKA